MTLSSLHLAPTGQFSTPPRQLQFLSRGRWGGQVVGDHLGVVAGYRGGEVGEGAGGEVHCVPVEDSAEGIARGETSVQDGKELVAHLGLDGHAIGRIKPRHLPPP